MSLFFEELQQHVLWFVLMCAFLSYCRGSKVTTGWLLTFFPLSLSVSLSLSQPPGATAETQSHNNGWLFFFFFFPGKRGWRWCVRGVYLSHGNWFAGVEVGSFERTSSSPTPSHLSVWECERRRMERTAAAAAFFFFTQRPEKVDMSEGSIWCQLEMKNTFYFLFYCILPTSAYPWTSSCGSRCAWL